MKIEVTERDILLGKKNSTTDDPISRAIRRRIKYESLVSVGSPTVLIGNKVFDLPKKMINWIDNYDRGSKVDPITFILIKRS